MKKIFCNRTHREQTIEDIVSVIKICIEINRKKAL